jgi:hypothetical protein
MSFTCPGADLPAVNLSPRQRRTIIAASQIWGQGAMRGVLTCLTRVCSNKRCAQNSPQRFLPVPFQLATGTPPRNRGC